MLTICTSVLLVVVATAFAILIAIKYIREPDFLRSCRLISAIGSFVSFGEISLPSWTSGAGNRQYFHKKLSLRPFSVIHAFSQASSTWIFTFLFVTLLAPALNLDSIIIRILIRSFVVSIIFVMWSFTICSIVKFGSKRARIRFPERKREPRRFKSQARRRTIRLLGNAPSRFTHSTARNRVEDIELDDKKFHGSPNVRLNSIVDEACVFDVATSIASPDFNQQGSFQLMSQPDGSHGEVSLTSPVSPTSTFVDNHDASDIILRRHKLSRTFRFSRSRSKSMP